VVHSQVSSKVWLELLPKFEDKTDSLAWVLVQLLPGASNCRWQLWSCCKIGSQASSAEMQTRTREGRCCKCVVVAAAINTPSATHTHFAYPPSPVKPQSCNIVKSQLHFDVGSRRMRRRSSGRSHNAFAGQVVPYNETIFNYLSK